MFDRLLKIIWKIFTNLWTQAAKICYISVMVKCGTQINYNNSLLFSSILFSSTLYILHSVVAAVVGYYCLLALMLWWSTEFNIWFVSRDLCSLTERHYNPKEEKQLPPVTSGISGISMYQFGTAILTYFVRYCRTCYNNGKSST